MGTHPITAVYSGDTNYNGATSSVLSQTVNQASSTVTLASSLNHIDLRYQRDFLLLLSRTGATGTVTFLDGATSLGTGTISTGIATLTTSSLAVGTHSITAQYGGDSNYNASVSTPVSQVVNKASSTVTLASSLNPSTFGASVTLTATVTSGANRDRDLRRRHDVPGHGNDQRWRRHADDQFAYGGHALDHGSVRRGYQLQRRGLNAGIPGSEHGDPDRHSRLPL